MNNEDDADLGFHFTFRKTAGPGIFTAAMIDPLHTHDISMPDLDAGWARRLLQRGGFQCDVAQT